MLWEKKKRKKRTKTKERKGILICGSMERWESFWDASDAAIVFLWRITLRCRLKRKRNGHRSLNTVPFFKDWILWELAMWSRQTSNSQWFSCLCLLSAGVKGMHHYTRQESFFLGWLCTDIKSMELLSSEWFQLVFHVALNVYRWV